MPDKEQYIQKFKALYKLKTGKKLSDSEAARFFEDLVTLVGVTYKTIPKASWKKKIK